jgi:hypothetical protein
MQIDLDKASKALSSLKNPTSSAAVDKLHEGLDAFRQSLGGNLNDAEFRYVMQTLFNDQVVTVKPDSALAKAPAATLKHGFTIRAVI